MGFRITGVEVQCVTCPILVQPALNHVCARAGVRVGGNVVGGMLWVGKGNMGLATIANGNTSLASFDVTAKLVCARGNSGIKGMNVDRIERCCHICCFAWLLYLQIEAGWH